MPARPLLFDFRRLTVFRGSQRALDGLDLSLRVGEHLAILGPNGSGKSTLVKTLLRELYPVPDTPGYRFLLRGEEFADITDFRRHLGVVAPDLLQQLSHEVSLRAVRGIDLVVSGFFDSLGLWPHLRPGPPHWRRARAALRLVGATDLAEREVATLSSGEQRRLLIARALVHEPDALLLDEPTSHLDPAAAIAFRATLRRLCRRGRSVVLVTHDVADLVPEIERVLLLKDGRVLADGPAHRVLSSAMLSRLFGADLRLRRQAGNWELRPA